MRTKLPKSEMIETELLFNNSLEDIAIATNNRLLMVEMKRKVQKFLDNMKGLSEDSGIPFEVKVHFKIINKKNKGR